MYELMLIEKDAKRFIVRGIDLERNMKTHETMERFKGNIVIRTPAYERLRKQFVDVCCQINAVANCEGKGRDDLKAEILVAAEEVARKISDNKSKAVRRLAAQIKQAFNGLRAVFRKYSESIDMVDPQLKNNTDLVEALVGFEKAWEKGKDFLLSGGVCSMLVSFSQLIEGLAEKYKEVREKIESMDSEIFMIIPCVAILRSLDENDSSIYALYYPASQSQDGTNFAGLRRMYQELRTGMVGKREVYNVMESAILDHEVDCTSKERADVGKLLNEIKRAAVLLQRSKPAEWNRLMETAMGII